ncbi:MAG: hypothetical protein LBC19_04170 [Tannerella sp.]|jgi:hypothetical protein|nr:hypothetical protein [Tannerella sp.]
MKIDFKKSFTGHDGETIGMIDEHLRLVLFSADSSDRFMLSAEEKYLAYKIGKRLLEEGGNIDLTVEEAGFIKKVCSFGLRAGAYGQLIDLIEGCQ